jgi:4-amino-4-deoxy-L-arabinose transferase-like glycosyltransferase
MVNLDFSRFAGREGARRFGVPDSNGSFVQRYGAYGLFLLAVLVLFVQLGSYPLQMQWEPNYGQVVREMVWDGNSITPTSKVGNDEGAAPGMFWSKPILIFWLAYPFYQVLGDSEWSARLPIALVGLFGVMMTYWLMARLFNRRTGLLAGLVLLTTPTYFLIARAYMVDAPFVVFMWLGVGFLMLGEKEGLKRWYLLFYAFMGLSALAKGLTPLMLVGAATVVYLLVSFDWRMLLRMRLVQGSLVFLAVAAPWYTYMSAKYDHWAAFLGALFSGKANAAAQHLPYVKKFFWDHHFERAMGHLDKPNDTFEMFVLYFAIGVLPWLAFLPQAIIAALPWTERKADKPRTELFFVVAFLVIFTFFSAISTKFPHYIFPAVPFAAMLIAIYLGRLMDSDSRDAVNRIGLLAGLMVFAIVAPDVLDAKNYRTIFYFITTERLQDWHPAVADPTGVFRILYLMFGLGMLVVFVIRRVNLLSFAPLALVALLYAGYINGWMIPKLTEMFSARSLVQTYLELRKSPDEPLGEFTQTWKSRSIKYCIPFDELKDRYRYRQYRIYNNEASLRRFYDANKGRRVFIIIEEKQKHFSRINAMWQEISGGEELVRLATDAVTGEPYKPEFWLISNRDNEGRVKRISSEQRLEQLKTFVGTTPMTPEVAVNAAFDDRITLVGWDKLPEKITAGSDLTVNLYFKAEQTPVRDYKIFLHAERDKLFRLRGDHIPVGGRYPTRRWEAGQYIKDVYKLDIPAATTEGHLDLFIGLFDGGYRPTISAIPQREPDNRVKIGRVIVERP